MVSDIRKVLIELEHVSRFYGTRCAVDNVSLMLRQGDVLGFLGPNGAGKSSTMRMLCGVLPPSSGRIIINGIDLLEQPKAAKAYIGFLPEQPPLYQELTVQEYLRFCARLHGVTRPHVATAVERALLRCGLQDCGSRLIRNLSKGFQQRVGIAQAIVHAPLLVVLDEPTVGLDPIQIREIRALIAEIGQEHGVILSTHILAEVQKVCNRVQIMHRGRMIFVDDTLQQQTQTMCRSVLLGLQYAPALQSLLEIAGVSHVTAIDTHRFRLEIDTPTQPDTFLSSLAQTCVQSGWGLFELTPETQSLEQIFVALTSQDTTETPHTQEYAA